MFELMREGGMPMWVVLLFGGATLVQAIRFAVRPDERQIGVFRSLSAATVFAVLSGTAADIGAVLHKVPNTPEWAQSPDLHLIVMTGFGESTSPAILGFTLLALAWFVLAVGMRRLLSAVD